MDIIIYIYILCSAWVFLLFIGNMSWQIMMRGPCDGFLISCFQPRTLTIDPKVTVSQKSQLESAICSYARSMELKRALQLLKDFARKKVQVSGVAHGFLDLWEGF